MNMEDKKKEFEDDWVRMRSEEFFRKYYWGSWSNL